jgi:hypothetical protein
MRPSGKLGDDTSEKTMHGLGPRLDGQQAAFRKDRSGTLVTA